MSNPDYQYETHNFDLVNRALNSEQNKSDQHAIDQRASNFLIYAKWGSILILAIGVCAFLVIWGASILLNPQPDVIVKEVVVKEPQTIYINPPEAKTTSTLSEDEKAVSSLKKIQEELAKGSTSAEKSTAVYDYTLFRRHTFEKEGITNVTVGMTFKDSSSKTPDNQFCYINRWEPKHTVSNRLDLAHKIGKNRATKVPLTRTIAREFGVNVSTLRDAQKLCSFM